MVREGEKRSLLDIKQTTCCFYCALDVIVFKPTFTESLGSLNLNFVGNVQMKLISLLTCGTGLLNLTLLVPTGRRLKPGRMLNLISAKLHIQTTDSLRWTTDILLQQTTDSRPPWSTDTHLLSQTTDSTPSPITDHRSNCTFYYTKILLDIQNMILLQYNAAGKSIKPPLEVPCFSCAVKSPVIAQFVFVYKIQSICSVHRIKKINNTLNAVFSPQHTFVCDIWC